MAQIQVEQTALDGVLVLTPRVFGDARGWFYESWADRDYRAAGVDVTFVQDNQSFSKERGTLRGIHFQNGEHAQAKLVRCTRGAVLDVAVDLRRGSPTYGSGRGWSSRRKTTGSFSSRAGSGTRF